MLIRKHFDNREEWLLGRGQGIGASDAGAIIGVSPWMTASDLWQFKTGAKKQKDISDNEAVSAGVRLEPALREMYRASHPDYSVAYYPFDILYQSERPYIFATLDGEITTADGRRGVLEIKTATPNSRQAWESWAGKIPNQYLAQCTHQLLSTGFDFVDLYAHLTDVTANEVIIRTYHIERVDAEADMEYLLAEEEKFWLMVMNKEIPPVKLSL